MRRIPEPDLMNDWTQAIAYANADFEGPHTAFIERLSAVFPGLPNTGHALDLGCGPGDITLRFAKAFPHWRIDGIDGAPSMLKLGEKRVQSQGFKNRISLNRVYLPQESPPQTHYDLIFSNSLLHHLTDPLDLWRSLRSFSHSHTPVFIMDLMRPDHEAIASNFVEQYAANEPDVLRTDFYNSLLAAYTIDEVRVQLKQLDLAHLHTEAVSDRHWITWGYPQQESSL